MSDPEALFELRWAVRRGLIPPIVQQRPSVEPMPAEAVSDPERLALPEPRRGSMRVSPSGGPQQPANRPPAAPERAGPEQPAENAFTRIQREELGNLFLAMRQGVMSSALNEAEPVDDAELRARLAPTWNDDGPEADRLNAARERAAELGIEVVFRIGRDGRAEAVQRTPEMEPPGGAVGRLADGLGRMLGLAFVDPVGGAAAVGTRAVRGGDVVAGAGGAGARRSRRGGDGQR